MQRLQDVHQVLKERARQQKKEEEIRTGKEDVEQAHHLIGKETFIGLSLLL